MHGCTYSHAIPAAAVARSLLKILRDANIVEATATRGNQVRAALEAELANDPWVGEIRGRGLLLGIELVADRASKAPHARAKRVTERVLAPAKATTGASC